MKVTPIKTRKVTAGTITLPQLLDESVATFSNKSVLVITSKIVSLCENKVFPANNTNKDELIEQEADYVMDEAPSKYGIHFTITNNTLIPTAGIDESNANNQYVLWPHDPQQTANDVREYLCERFNLEEVGVVISDSTCSPLRWGTSGISIAHSGFKATNSYIGTPDLFGKPFKVSQANIAGGLAASAVVTMGEGREQQPLCVIEDVPFVQFQAENPSIQELQELTISLEDDLFAPFLSKATWHKGNRHKM